MISIVVPVYNNSAHLVELNKQVSRALKTREYELILVDDCSQDDSVSVIESLVEKYHSIKLIKNEKNIGQQMATLKGIVSAIGEVIVVLDADLQDNPSLIPQMVKTVLNNNATVFILRQGQYQSKSRMLTSILTKRIISALVGLHHKAGAYYAFPVEQKNRITELAGRFKSPYLTIIVAKTASKLIYLKAQRSKRLGSSSYSGMKRLATAARAVSCAVKCSLIKVKEY